MSSQILLQIRSLGPPGAPVSQAPAEMLIGPRLSLSLFHPCILLCGMIKVSIKADSWHVGAACIYERERDRVQTEKEEINLKCTVAKGQLRCRKSKAS